MIVDEPRYYFCMGQTSHTSFIIGDYIKRGRATLMATRGLCHGGHAWELRQCEVTNEEFVDFPNATAHARSCGMRSSTAGLQSTSAAPAAVS